MVKQSFCDKQLSQKQSFSEQKFLLSHLKFIPKKYGLLGGTVSLKI